MTGRGEPIWSKGMLADHLPPGETGGERSYKFKPFEALADLTSKGCTKWILSHSTWYKSCQSGQCAPSSTPNILWYSPVFATAKRGSTRCVVGFKVSDSLIGY